LRGDNSGRKIGEASEGVEYDFYFTEYDFCPVWSRVLILSNQINLFIVINIWGIIKAVIQYNILSLILGTHHLQATVTMWFLNIWDNVPMDLKYVCQQYFTYMCFLGFIRYNKTLIANLFLKIDHRCAILYIYCMLVREIWKCIHPRGIWYSCVDKFSYVPHQHAINV
jgi:hypothetical protein